MWLHKLLSVFILVTITVKAERYYESESTRWEDVMCSLGEPQLKYSNGFFEVNETLSIRDDVWIGYLYAKVPFLLLGCAGLPRENGVYVKEFGDCFTICRGGTFGIKRQSDGMSGFSCICIMGFLDAYEPSCKDGNQTNLCNNCYEVYTQINVNASNVGNKSEGDCLTYYYPHLWWQPCTRKDYIRSMCSNSAYTDHTAIATITESSETEWSAGNKLCLTNRQHQSFERSIINSGFGNSQRQYFWTGIFRATTLIKLSLKDLFSRFSNDLYVYADSSSLILWVAHNGNKRRALCVTETESTSSQPETPKSTTDVTPSLTTSTLSDTSEFLTKVTTPDVTMPVGSKDSPALGIGIGVSVGMLFLVGGAVFIVVLRRRGILHCNRKPGNDKPSRDEPALKENMTYGKSIDDKVPNNNYFILEKCEQPISNNVEHYNESNEANMEEDYNSIQETEDPYEHIEEENCDYDHTINASTSGSDARKLENVYNKLKIDRSRDFNHDGKHGPNVVNISGDDYDTTSSVLTHGTDAISDYNHVPRTAYKAGATGDDIKGDKGGEYDAINGMTFKVAQSDDSDYAHVNKDRIQ